VHADKVEPEFYVLGYIFKARRRDCLKAGFLALPPYIPDECLIDIQRWSIFFSVKREKHIPLTNKIDQLL
jgi:hypothetical protein